LLSWLLPCPLTSFYPLPKYHCVHLTVQSPKPHMHIANVYTYTHTHTLLYSSKSKFHLMASGECHISAPSHVRVILRKEKVAHTRDTSTNPENRAMRKRSIRRPVGPASLSHLQKGNPPSFSVPSGPIEAPSVPQDCCLVPVTPGTQPSDTIFLQRFEEETSPSMGQVHIPV
jgi:hypothetical protein